MTGPNHTIVALLRVDEWDAVVRPLLDSTERKLDLLMCFAQRMFQESPDEETRSRLAAEIVRTGLEIPEAVADERGCVALTYALYLLPYEDDGLASEVVAAFAANRSPDEDLGSRNAAADLLGLAFSQLEDAAPFVELLESTRAGSDRTRDAVIARALLLMAGDFSISFAPRVVGAGDPALLIEGLAEGLKEEEGAEPILAALLILLEQHEAIGVTSELQAAIETSNLVLALHQVELDGAAMVSLDPIWRELEELVPWARSFPEAPDFDPSTPIALSVGEPKWFRIAESAKKRYALVLRSGSVSVTIIDSGREVLSADEHFASGERTRIRIRAGSQGDTYVRLRADDSELKLEVVEEEAPSSLPVEVAMEDAVKIQPNTSYECALGGSTETWVRVAVTQGRTYVIETFVDSNVDTVIQARGADDNTNFLSDDDGGTGLGSRIEWLAKTTGDVLISVENIRSTGGFFEIRVDG